MYRYVYDCKTGMQFLDQCWSLVSTDLHFCLFGNQISMSVLRMPVSVMKMQVVIIRMVPTAVPVNRDSLEMDQLVMVSD